MYARGERKGGCCSSKVFRVKVLALEVRTYSESSIYSRYTKWPMVDAVQSNRKIIKQTSKRQPIL